MLVDKEIKKLIKRNVVVYPDRDSINYEDLINPASLDIRLGRTLLVEKKKSNKMVGIVDPVIGISPEFQVIDLFTTENKCCFLNPGEFALANTIEIFNLPENISAQFQLKSSLARSGLGHLLAGFCDPGWHNSTLTLELHNVLKYNKIALQYGMKIGQIIFTRIKQPKKSYRITGHYNNKLTTTPAVGQLLK